MFKAASINTSAIANLSAFEYALAPNSTHSEWFFTFVKPVSALPYTYPSICSSLGDFGLL